MVNLFLFADNLTESITEGGVTTQRQTEPQSFGAKSETTFRVTSSFTIKNTETITAYAMLPGTILLQQ